MKLYYVIKNLRANYYVHLDGEFSDDIMSALEFKSEQEAMEFAYRHFDYQFTFTIEKVYQIKK